MGRVGSQAALTKIGESWNYLQECVQKGPEGVRVLAFIGGCVQCGYYFLCCWNILMLIYNPFRYFTDVTLVVFSWVIIVWEASDEILQDWRSLQIYQSWVAEYCKILALPWFLGSFYLYLGCQQILMSNVTISFPVLFGLYFCFLGVVNLALHFGYDISGPAAAL